MASISEIIKSSSLFFDGMGNSIANYNQNGGQISSGSICTRMKKNDQSGVDINNKQLTVYATYETTSTSPIYIWRFFKNGGGVSGTWDGVNTNTGNGDFNFVTSITSNYCYTASYFPCDISANAVSYTYPSKGSFAVNQKFTVCLRFDFNLMQYNIDIFDHTNNIFIENKIETYTGADLTEIDQWMVHFGNVNGSTFCKYYSAGVWGKKLTFKEVNELIRNDQNVA
jgi:hypothetical protein